MNNYLPIALMAALMAGKNGNDENNVSKVLSLLGMGGEGANAFSGLLNGDLSMESVLPLILRSMSDKNAHPTEKENPSFGDEGAGEDEEDLSPVLKDENTPNYLLPITDIAGDEINYALSHYFANN